MTAGRSSARRTTSAWRPPGSCRRDQQLNLPRIQFCDAASDESKRAAEGLRFQAARIFALDVDESPRNHQVFVQEFLMADDEDTIDETYAALADGIAACDGEKTDYGDGVVGRSSLIPSTTLGTESRVSTTSSRNRTRADPPPGTCAT